MTAAKMGRDRSRPLRKDWEQVKDELMRTAVAAKFLPQIGEALAKPPSHVMRSQRWN